MLSGGHASSKVFPRPFHQHINWPAPNGSCLVFANPRDSIRDGHEGTLPVALPPSEVMRVRRTAKEE